MPVTHDTTFTTGEVLPASETITTTTDNPFWSVTRQQWVDAGALADGEQLLGTGTGRVTVKGARSGSVSPPATREVVYNLTVAGPHTYQVGAAGVLVHNTGCELDSNGWPKAVEDATNCMECAAVIQKKIGGQAVKISPSGGTNMLWDTKNNPGRKWDAHYMIEKDGRYYDAYTGPNGITKRELDERFGLALIDGELSFTVTEYNGPLGPTR